MKRTIHLILCMMFCAAPFFSLAQVTIEFTSFEVSNVSNRFFSSGGVYSVITATLRNTSDKPVTLLLSNEDVRFGYVYFSKIRGSWVHYDSQFGGLKDTILIEPKSFQQVFLSNRWSQDLFASEGSLYYLSDIASSMRLFLEMPGQEVVMSDVAQNVRVNGVGLDMESFNCNRCGSIYTLVNNPLMFEYIRMQSWLFQEGIYNTLIRQEFACNMFFARKLYSMMALPKISRR